MVVKTSVCICTINRVDDLYQSIQSVINQTVPNDQYEIIVVDNGSSDGTSHMIHENFGKISNLRYIYEPRPGLSQARNTGCSVAQGEYILFLDDDAIASSDWIESILNVYQDYPDAWLVGGKVELLMEGRPSDWLHPDLLGFLGKLDLGCVVKPIVLPDHLYGLNFSLKADAIKEVGNFSTRLGRGPSNLLSGEEVDVMKRVLQKGGVCYYSPQAIVKHIVHKERLEKSFFYHRSFWQGYSESIRSSIELQNSSNIINFCQVLRFTGILFFRIGAYLLLFPFSDHQNRFRRLCMISSCRGSLRHELEHLLRICQCRKRDP
jgi:glycosyltransferase involved in cell wall biosynthesis